MTSKVLSFLAIHLALAGANMLPCRSDGTSARKLANGKLKNSQSSNFIMAPGLLFHTDLGSSVEMKPRVASVLLYPNISPESFILEFQSP